MDTISLNSHGWIRISDVCFDNQENLWAINSLVENALVVKVQPDDAEWDAGDVRYNVLRWTSSPRPPFGGYGPSMTNPRTGEIIGADIMLEFVHFTNKQISAPSYMQPSYTTTRPDRSLLLCYCSLYC